MSAPTQPILTADPELDEQRRRGLRRMRTLAVSLLVVSVILIPSAFAVPAARPPVDA